MELVEWWSGGEDGGQIGGRLLEGEEEEVCKGRERELGGAHIT
jgi:hypothetical protein